jgi:predicted RNA-binding protein YlqC (UPF0109 family)
MGLTKLGKLLEYLVKEIVSKPDAVKVKEEEKEDAIRLFISVDPEDMGLVIGKSGRNISAIRSLVKTAATKAGKEVFLELEEAE